MRSTTIFSTARLASLSPIFASSEGDTIAAMPDAHDAWKGAEDLRPRSEPAGAASERSR
jgi:hypothetical protein